MPAYGLPKAPARACNSAAPWWEARGQEGTMNSKASNKRSSMRLARPPGEWRLWLAAMVAAGCICAGVVDAQVPSRDLTTYVLLGLDKIQMKEFSFANVGNIGVNNGGGTLQWGRKSF